MFEIKELTKSKINDIVEIYKEYNKKDSEIIKDVYTRFYSKIKKKRNPNVKDYILTRYNEVIAFSGFNKEETETIDIYWLNWTATKKSHLKNGHARDLMNFIKKELISRKCRKLYVSTSSINSDAIKFYTSQGFKIEGRLKDYYKLGEDSLYLSLLISGE